MKLAVVGAGIVGSAAAADLAQEGADVTLVEARPLLQGTSGTSYAWINSNNKAHPAYFRLNLGGVHRHRAGPASGRTSFHATGHLEVASTEEHRARLSAKVDRLRASGYAVRDVDATEAVEQLAGIGRESVLKAVAYPEEGYCDVPTFVAEAHERLRAAGGEFVSASVDRLQPDGAGVDVLLANGERRRFDAAVVTTGRWTQEFLARSGFSVPMNDDDSVGAPAFGFLATTRPAAVTCPPVVTTSSVNFRPAGEGRYLLQGLDLDTDAHPSASREVRHRVGATLAHRFADVHGLADAPQIENVAVGVRPLPADGLAVAGFLDDARAVYVAVTHSGVTLAPELAALITQEVVQQEQAPELAPFRPQRFAAGAGAHDARPARRAGEQ